MVDRKFRPVAIALLILLAVAVGVTMIDFGARLGLLILVIGITLLMSVGAMGRLRSSLGAGIGLVQYAGLWLLGAAILTITFSGLRVTTFLTVSDLILLITAAVLLLAILADRTPIITTPSWLLIGGIGLLVAGFLASFTAIDLAHDVVASGEFAIALLGVPILLAQGTGNATRVLFIARLWLLSASVNATVALTDLAHLTSIGTLPAGRPTGLTSHPNHVGMICAMAVPIALYFLINARSILSRGLYAVALALVSFGALASGSRAAILAAFAGAILVPLLGRRMWRPVIGIAAAAAVLLFATSLVITPDQSSPLTANPFIAIERLTHEASISNSDTARLDYYRTAISDFISNPLTGTGFDLIRDAHDIYLQLLEAGGILAFVSFMVFAFGALRLGVRLTGSDALEDPIRNLAAALTASLAVWLLGSLVQNFVYDRFLYVPVGLLIGLSQITAGRINHGERQAGDSISDGSAGSPGWAGR